MKLKLDENLSLRACSRLAEDGHDVSSVALQKMEAEPDSEVIAACLREGRVLVTLDLDFANPFIFPPSEYPGIAELRLPKKASAEDGLQVVATLAEGLQKNDITGKLWIVERSRIRIYQQPE